MKIFAYKQFLIFLLSVFVMVVSIIYALFQAPKLENNLKWVNHTHEVINQLESLVFNISESESIGLGYLLTENEMFLKKYNTAIRVVNKNLERIIVLIAFDPIPRREMEQLRLLTVGKIDLQDEAILLKRNHTLNSKQLAVKFNLGRLYLESIKTLIAKMEMEEQSVLAKRQEETNTIIVRTMYGILFSFIATFIIGFYLTMFTRQYLREQKELETKLMELNENKNKFFSIISHDLRGPVNNIVKLSEFVRKESSEEERKKISGMIETSIKKVSDLLNNLLKWASVQMNAVNIIPQVIFPQKLVDENLSILNEEAKIKNISLINEVKPDVMIWADYNMINTVIRNLVSNSIKFTKTGGKITISAENRDNKTLLTVKDNGVGMTKETLANLFIPGTKTTGVGTANERGSGLGLQICKEFIERNGGTIFVESKLNQGSVFKFTLWSRNPQNYHALNGKRNFFKRHLLKKRNSKSV